MKKILIFLLSLLIILGTFITPVYAARPTGNKTVSVTGVSLNVESLTLEVGQTQTLTAKVMPKNATNKAVTWSSSDSLVAAVDTNGLVEAISAGTATIIVTTADGGYTGTCAVMVMSPPSTLVPVSGVSLNINTLTLEAGQTQTLTATVSPDNATNKTVIWSTSNSSFATVDVNGLVTAVSTGTATITATTEEGGFTNSCVVTVVSPQSTNIHYVALGDSIATGTTSRGTTNAYINGFYDYLKTKYTNNTVSMTDLSNDGDASTELLSKLKTATFQSEVSKANIITISIGGNNIMDAGQSSFSQIDHTIAETGTLAFEKEYIEIISQIRSLNPTVKIFSMTLYNPYNTISISGYTNDPTLQKEVQPYISRINNQITGISDDNYIVADVYSRFLTYANDGKMGSITYFYPNSWFKFTRDPHPNQTGQNLISDIHKEAFLP